MSKQFVAHNESTIEAQSQEINSSFMQYFAHSANTDESWHLLKDHLHGTVEMMSTFTLNQAFRRVFKYAGLLHDLGKYQLDFQKYLKEGGRRGSVPHAVWGAGLARKLKLPEVAFVVDGHHKGLPDKAKLITDTFDFQDEDHQLNNDVKNRFFTDLGITEDSFTPDNLGLEVFDKELFIRFLFSSLTDADWLDTEKHFKKDNQAIRKPPEFDCNNLIQKLDSYLLGMEKTGNLNHLRNGVRAFALTKAKEKSGFFSLNLPTGMGKTLTSVSWALHHARENEMKRIIIVLPFVNIIDQTAQILKEIFGDRIVLEHHSSYNEKESNNAGDLESQGKESTITKLATENWDFPIIVTTTVQFFDSLFSNKPKRCRKIHNIADSVVIFDEVQSLPKELISPTMSILRSINSIMSTSFVFCTATQPAFEKRPEFRDGISTIIPLVENVNSLFQQTKRVSYKPISDFNPIPMEQLLNLMIKENRSVLSIFNTKKNTLEVYNQIKLQSIWDCCYHLSTAMCPEHRKEIVQNIKNDLINRKSVFLASTQLIEAGVDLDFPCIFREIAPLESIIQSAGRCNREGKMNDLGQLGDVNIFCLFDSKFPDPLYKTLTQHTVSLLKQDIDQLYEFDFFTRYYSSAVRLFVDTDKNKINEARKEFKFETVAGAYHLIDKRTKSLFIANYNTVTLNFLDSIKDKKFLGRDDYRFMQMFSVQVYPDFLLKTKKQWEEKEQGYHVWYGSYKNETGITPEPDLTANIV